MNDQIKDRVTIEDIENEIVKEDFHVFPGTTMTVCCLTLQNGCSIIGEASCVNPENFDAEMGRKISREKAKAKIWPLLGFRLMDARKNLGGAK